MSSSMKKFAPRREHKERGQIASRQKLGHLEKHKDYVLRARDYSDKQKQLKRLRERAAARNPDEFYFNMERSQMKNGQHIEERNEVITPEMQRLMDTQDITYVRMQRDINRHKIERLQSEMHIVDTTKNVHLGPRHTVFVDNEEEVRTFDAAKHFDTLPEFMNRKFNRPTLSVLEETDIARPSNKDLRAAASAREAKLRELKERLSREDHLKRTESEMAIRKALREKGKKKKVGTDRLGLAVYKWRAERKK
ncbi:hypothetical protein LPJ66_005342 [Kickxella alabastrina]|uniref:Uncharacterized protein n=1 Tax=Kickxella alabastrina TaxID=61397 RepID=A0ACC1IH60_9FUNG|nr:hypothetical protein LPJ66_005342 [Kickxella alabastrina]